MFPRLRHHLALVPDLKLNSIQSFFLQIKKYIQQHLEMGMIIMKLNYLKERLPVLVLIHALNMGSHAA
jgi:hypothetical protein